MAEEESMLLCLSYDGLWRVVIPDYGKLRREYPPLRMEKVFSFDPHLLPRNMGIFSSAQKVYLVGGKDYHPVSHVFDPTSFEKFPVEVRQFDYKPIEMPLGKYEPLRNPIVIRAKEQIYFLTQYVCPWYSESIERFCVQSFDPKQNLFGLLSTPSCKSDGDKGATWKVAAHFAAFDYIYLFIQHDRDWIDSFRFKRAFSYNTISAKWEDAKVTAGAFTKKRIPIPLLHRGDTGVSVEISRGTWYVVALCRKKPIVYRMTRDENGHLKPISFRFLEEIKFNNHPSNVHIAMVHLHDMGSGRFCAIYESPYIPLEVYIFEIDFEVEDKIQRSQKPLPGCTSSKLLDKLTILDDDPLVGFPSFYAYCLASAPAPQSSANLVAADEEEHNRDGQRDKGTQRKRTKEGRGRRQCTTKGRDE